MTRGKDFLEDIIEERTAQNADFPALVEAAFDRRQLLRSLAELRQNSGASQTDVAARMGTSQSSIARMEAGDVDVRLSTVDRYAAAVGAKLVWTVTADRRRRMAGSRAKKSATRRRSVRGR